MFGKDTIMIDWGTSKIAWYVNGDIHTMPNQAVETPNGPLGGAEGCAYLTRHPDAPVLAPPPGLFFFTSAVSTSQVKTILREVKPTVPWYRRLFRFDVLVAVPKDLTAEESKSFMDSIRFLVGNLLLVDCVAAAAALASKAGSAVAVAEIGTGFAKYAVVKQDNRYLRFAHRGIGGRDLDTALAAHLQKVHSVTASRDELEKLRCQLGIRETFRIGAAELTRKEIQSVYWGVLDDFAEAMNAELKKAPEEVRQQGVALSGGLARLVGITEYFERKTGCRFRTVDQPEKTVIRGLPKLLAEIPKELR